MIVERRTDQLNFNKYVLGIKQYQKYQPNKSKIADTELVINDSGFSFRVSNTILYLVCTLKLTFCTLVVSIVLNAPFKVNIEVRFSEINSKLFSVAFVLYSKV